MGEVILGMAGNWAIDYCEYSDHYTTKIGGLPDWPVSNLEIRAELLRCSLCQGRLCLVAQVYAPIRLLEVNAQERVIYVLACRKQECSSNHLSWRALRVQRHDSVNELASTSVVGMQLDVTSTSISKPNNYLEDSLLKDSSEPDDESDSDAELEDLAQALAEASSLASCSKKQNDSKNYDASTKLSQCKTRTIGDIAEAPLPCFYVYSKVEQSCSSAGDFCASYNSLSPKDKGSINSDIESEEKWEEENYEYDRALGADRIYLKFKKRMDAEPEQCFRYSYGGKPLVATKNLVEPENCKSCGSSRSYEMQLMPSVLYFLQQGADDSSNSPPDGWSWMTLIIYTCSKSCFSPGPKNINHHSWEVVEEAVMIQDE